jgi:hypothetical protein
LIQLVVLIEQAGKGLVFCLEAGDQVAVLGKHGNSCMVDKPASRSGVKRDVLLVSILILRGACGIDRRHAPDSKTPGRARRFR